MKLRLDRWITSLVILASTLSAPAAETPLVDRVCWPEFLARHDLLWSRLPRSTADAILLGNGQIGASITGGPNQMNVTFHRQDVLDRRPFVPESWDSPLFETCRLQIGTMELVPVGKIRDFTARLDLWNAQVTGKILTDKGQIEFRALIHAQDPLLMVRVETSGQENDCRWHWQPASTNSPRVDGFKSRGLLKREYQSNPPSRLEQKGEISLSEHPLLNGEHFAVGWLERKPAASRRELLATIMPVSSHAGQDAADLLAKAPSPESLISSHQDLWHRRYPASFLSVPGTRAEAYYWINIYKLYCATRADQPPIDVQGIWMTQTGWPNIWWNLNIQLAYQMQATANRLDLAESLCSNLEKMAPTLSTNIPQPQWQQDSAWVGRVSDQQFRCGAGKHWPINEEVANLSWTMEAFYRQCRWSGDDRRLRESFLPLLEKCLNTYRHILEEKADGKLHLPMTGSPESGGVTDCNYDLGALRWDLQTLIGESQRLGLNAEKIPQWRALQARIVDYPQGPDGLWLGAKKSLERSHRHYSHLLAFYPLGVLDWDHPGDRDLIQRSVNHWFELFTHPTLKREDFYGYSLTGACSMYAWMGNAARAHEALEAYLDTRATRNASYTEGTLEVGFAFGQSLHDLLLQSRKGLIRLFPAVPETWKDVAFHHLRTEGAFLISAARKNGQTQWVRVESLMGEPCRILLDGKIHELKLQKGESISLGTSAPILEAVPADPHYLNYYGLPAKNGK